MTFRGRGRRRFSLNRPLQPRGRAYLNEPTIEITNGDFCQQVFSRRYTRAFLASRSVDNFAFNLYSSGPPYVYIRDWEGKKGREEDRGARSFFVRARIPHLAFFFSFLFLLFICYHHVADTARNRLKQLDFQAFGSRPMDRNLRGAGLGLLSR